MKLLKIILFLIAALIILDKVAGKILKLTDPAFRKILKAKLRKQDISLAREEVLHILKPVNNIVA